MKGYCIPYKHNQSWYIGAGLALTIWALYVTLLLLEAVFMTSSGLGKISLGLTKACLYERTQNFVPTGCYAYESSYGKALSNNCNILDIDGDGVDFCDKRKASAGLVLVNTLISAVSIGGIVLVLLDVKPKMSNKVAQIPHWFASFTTFVTLCVIGSINTAYTKGNEPGDPDWWYGASFWIIFTLFFAHILATMTLAHAVLRGSKVVRTSARRLSDITALGRPSKGS